MKKTNKQWERLLREKKCVSNTQFCKAALCDAMYDLSPQVSDNNISQNLAPPPHPKTLSRGMSYEVISFGKKCFPQETLNRGLNMLFLQWSIEGLLLFFVYWFVVFLSRKIKSVRVKTNISLGGINGILKENPMEINPAKTEEKHDTASSASVKDIKWWQRGSTQNIQTLSWLPPAIN